MMKKSILFFLLLFVFFTLIFEQALAQTPGSLRWEIETGAMIKSSPAISSDGTIYIGSNDNKLYAINPNGTIKWKLSLYGDVYSSPAIGRDGTIYVGTSHKTRLYAIDPKGKINWYFDIGYDAYSSPAIGPDGTIYVGSNDNRLYAINPDGSKKWEFETVSEVHSSPAIGADGTIYIGGTSDDKFYAINPNGTKEWEFKTTDSESFDSPAIGSDGTIYVGSSEDKLYAINTDGTKKWEFETTGGVNSPAIGADGTIYIGSGDNKLLAINPDGTKKLEIQTNSVVFTAPTIDSDGTIYTGQWYGSLYAFNPDGTKKWEFETQGAIRSPAIGTDGTIFIGSSDGKIYALFSESKGLANSPWPKFRKNSFNSGFAGDIACQNDFSVHMIQPGKRIVISMDCYSSILQDVIIEDIVFSDHNIFTTQKFPLVMNPGSTYSVPLTFQSTKSGYFESKYSLIYSINSKNNQQKGTLKTIVFIEDLSETVHTANKAIEAYNKAEGNNQIARNNNLGILFRLVEEHEYAEYYIEKALNEAINMRYSFAGIKMNKGVIKSDVELSTVARDFYTSAYEDVESNEASSVLAPQIYYNQAWENYMDGDFTKSEELALKTINHSKSNNYLKAKAYVLLGTIQTTQDKTDFAETSFLQAIDLDSQGPIGKLAGEKLGFAQSISDQAGLNFNINIFPNPADEFFYADFSALPFKNDILCRVYNYLGQLVFQKQIIESSGMHRISTKGFGNGIFEVIFYNDDNFIQKKLIVRSTR